MKKTIAFIMVILAVMTITAILIKPKAKDDEKSHILWVSGNDQYKQMVAEMFNKQSKTVDVSIDPNNIDSTKILVQCSAGIGGDVFDYVNEGSIQKLQSAGVLLKLDDFAQKYGITLDSLVEPVKKLCLVGSVDKQGNFTEAQYTYPATVDNDFIIYNKAVFDKYNVPYPPEDLTWDEYINISKKLTKYRKAGDSIPETFGAIGAKGKFFILLWEKGGDVFKDNLTASGMDTPEAFEALKFYHSLFFKHKVEPTSMIMSGMQASRTGSVSSTSTLSAFGEGQVAMIWGSRFYLKELRIYQAHREKLKEQWEKDHPGKSSQFRELRYGACQVPRFKDSKRYNMTYTGRTIGINALTRHKDASLEFLSYFASPEYNLYICETGSAKPPNKKYWKPEYFYNSKYPEEKPIHDMSIKAVSSGRSVQRSPFIDTPIAWRILNKALEVISLRENLTDDEIKKIAKDIADKTNAIIKRNIERDKGLKIYYDKERAKLSK